MNKDVVIIGGGSSVNEGIEKGLWDRLRESTAEVWSINYAFKVMPFLPDREVWVDGTFFRNNTNILEELNNKGVICCSKKEDRYLYLPQIKQYPIKKTNNDKEGIFIGTLGLSGMLALGIAVLEGYNRIFLLGYDFGTTNQGVTFTHFYQDKTDYISTGVGRPQVYLESFDRPKKNIRDFDFYKDKGEIYNVSLKSHINSYPKLSYEEFYEKLCKKEKNTPLL